MRKYIYPFLLCLISHAVFCQDVVINGDNKNRPLNWNDFTGNPDKTSRFDAYTYWNVKYHYKRVAYNRDTATIIEPVVTLELNNKLSWVKPGRESAWLLKHEQGHFDIGLLCQKELIDKITNTVFTRYDFRDKINEVFKTVLDTYKSLGIKYDEETNHGKNTEKQQTWDEFFSKELRTGNSL